MNPTIIITLIASIGLFLTVNGDASDKSSVLGQVLSVMEGGKKKAKHSGFVSGKKVGKGKRK